MYMCQIFYLLGNLFRTLLLLMKVIKYIQTHIIQHIIVVKSIYSSLTSEYKIKVLTTVTFSI